MRVECFKKVASVCIFITQQNPMKYFNKAFDIFLYEGVFIFLFSCFLLLLNDRYTDLFFKVSITSLLIAAILWVTGYTFNLFAKEDQYEES